jgi:hypothetical protein
MILITYSFATEFLKTYIQLQEIKELNLVVYGNNNTMLDKVR